MDDPSTSDVTEGFGLMFYNARWYDPGISKFIQPDTLIPEQTQGTQAWDRYAYVNNNPVRYNDPSGHCIGPVIVACFVVGVIVVVAAANLAESSIMDMQHTASQPAFRTEQVALQQWQDVCTIGCHNSGSGSVIGSAGPAPATPLTDQFSSSMADLVAATEQFIGGVGLLGGIPASAASYSNSLRSSVSQSYLDGQCGACARANNTQFGDPMYAMGNPGYNPLSTPEGWTLPRASDKFHVVTVNPNTGTVFQPGGSTGMTLTQYLEALRSVNPNLMNSNALMNARQLEDFIHQTLRYGKP